MDSINYCSLSYLLPLGLFDLEKVRGERIVLRKGIAGEKFAGIRKDEVNVQGRYTLVDSDGPFGSPTSDSERTSIRDNTVRALIVIYAPAAVEQSKLEEHARFTAAMVARYGGGCPRATVEQLAG